MKKQALWWLAAVLLAGGLVAQYAIYRSQVPSVVHASWALQPNSFEEVVNAADTIVQADVVAVEPGPDIVIPLPGEPEGEDRIPTQHVRVNVVDTDKGQAAGGQQLVVFRTGGERTGAGENRGGRQGPPNEQRNNTQRMAPPAGEKGGIGPESPPPQRPASAPDAPEGGDAASMQARVFSLPDDPPYSVGDRVFLALTNGPNNTKRPVHPAGRYRVNGNRVEAVGHDPVSASLNGRDVAELKRASRGQGNLPTAPGKRRETTGEGALPGMPTTGEARHSHAEANMTAMFGVAAALVLIGTGVVLAVRRRRA